MGIILFLIVLVIGIAIYFAVKQSAGSVQKAEQSDWLPPPPPLNDWKPRATSTDAYSISYDGNAEVGQPYPFDIVGEASYQGNIATFVIKRGDSGVFTELKAVIEHEPTNQYDANACKVTVENLTVGYLASNHAKSWLNMLSKQDIPLNAKIHVSAVIVGGGKGFENYGVRLDMPTRVASVAKYLGKI